MTCERCGREGQTKRVNFYRNIGAILFHFTETTECRLCKPCINEVFLNYTLINITLGWWGMASMFLTPIYILSNTIQYALCLGMKSTPKESTPVKTSLTSIVKTDNKAPTLTKTEKGEIVECPYCKMRVCVTDAVTCPSCRTSL